MKNSTQATQAPVKLPRRQAPTFEAWSVVVFSASTGFLLTLSMQNLSTDPSMSAVAKSCLIGGIAGLVSYGTNRFAIEKGAELAATGFKTAGAVSILSIAAVGAGLFPSTYAGLVINDVKELQIHDHVQRQSQFIGGQNQLALEASRLTPVIRANERELLQIRDCEQKESCLSGFRTGGRGPTTKLLEQKARRAGSIADQLASGEEARKASLKRLNQLTEEFQQVLGDPEKSIKEKRQALIGIDASIKQELATLAEALPVNLLQAYEQELENGASLPRSPVAQKRLNTLLSKHAEGMSSVLSTLQRDRQAAPSFPTPAGVGTTFRYLSHFIPVAALAACIELIFPITLWVYAVLELTWLKHKNDPYLDQRSGNSSLH